MTSYLQLFFLILPVLGLVAVGVVVRRLHWVEGETETSIVRLIVNLFYPCLIFESVAGNPALRQASNVLLPPVLGFAIAAGSILLCLRVGKSLGLTKGAGLRTYAVSTGICNYGYLPIPIVAAIWGGDTQGVLLVHNVGVEACMWTVGVTVMTGTPIGRSWRALLSPIVITLFVSLALNLAGLGTHIPGVAMNLVHSLAILTIPIGLLMIGVMLASYLGQPRELYNARVTFSACILRLCLLPLAIVAIARWLPCSVELKRVLVIQAAMPAGVFPIIVARHYGGHPLTAVRVSLATTVVGILTIPLWIRLGLLWARVS